MAEDNQFTDMSLQDTTATQDQMSSEVTDASVTTQAPVEKMIPQSQVNKIAAREAREAAEKARQQAIAEYEQRIAQQSQQQQQASNQAQSLGGMQQMSPDQIRQMIQQEAFRMSQANWANKIAQDFDAKIKAAKLEDPDFADKYEALNLAEHPKLVLWLNSMDNTTDIIKDIADYPTKMANIMMLANSGFEQLAQKEIKKLSDSIKANKQAQQQPSVNEPLSQIKPSTIDMGNGSMSVSDLRNLDFMRA